MTILKCGDGVAVLPRTGSLPQDVLGNAKVVYVGATLIEIDDWRIFYASDGRSLLGPQDGCIVLENEEQRAALMDKGLSREPNSPSATCPD
jgi:hypothetical protein